MNFKKMPDVFTRLLQDIKNFQKKYFWIRIFILFLLEFRIQCFILQK